MWQSKWELPHHENIQTGNICSQKQANWESLYDFNYVWFYKEQW